MNCPICKQPVSLTSPGMPFCSPRCRLIDLGAWASEGYVISTPFEPEQEAATAPRESDED
jgi:hypothetical protein